MSALERVDVGAALDRLGIRAKRQGREWWACCPFHGERSPSFSVRDDPGRDKHGCWRCFGECEVRGGSLVGLVSRVLSLEPRDAYRWLVGDASAPGPELPSDVEVQVVDPLRRYCGRFQLPAGVVLDPLDRWVTPAREYAARRGLTAEQVDRWRLGYAAEGYLAGRLVFPVRGRSGRLLSYTGRTFTAAPKKWREPRGEEGADKGAVFGEQWWPPVADRLRVVVSEAALDALAVERVYGGCVAAAYGSQLLPGHVNRLSTFEEVVVASDPDPAGEKFAQQVRGALARWCCVRRARLPDGYDASALEREAPEELRRVLDRAG